jgi:hypothetical protein
MMKTIKTSTPANGVLLVELSRPAARNAVTGANDQNLICKSPTLPSALPLPPTPHHARLVCFYMLQAP